MAGTGSTFFVVETEKKNIKTKKVTKLGISRQFSEKQASNPAWEEHFAVKCGLNVIRKGIKNSSEKNEGNTTLRFQ